MRQKSGTEKQPRCVSKALTADTQRSLSPALATMAIDVHLRRALWRAFASPARSPAEAGK
jgi:hypothetical protein